MRPASSLTNFQDEPASMTTRPPFPSGRSSHIPLRGNPRHTQKTSSPPNKVTRGTRSCKTVCVCLTREPSASRSRVSSRLARFPASETIHDGNNSVVGEQCDWPPSFAALSLGVRRSLSRWTPADATGHPGQSSAANVSREQRAARTARMSRDGYTVLALAEPARSILCGQS